MNDDDDIIRIVPPRPDLPADEFYSWGAIIFRHMTSQEFGERFPDPRQKEAKKDQAK